MVAASLTEARLRWGTPDCGRHGKKGVSGVVTTVEGDAFHVRLMDPLIALMKSEQNAKNAIQKTPCKNSYALTCRNDQQASSLMAAPTGKIPRRRSQKAFSGMRGSEKSEELLEDI
ncbi:hypothetical protein NDU88_004180 [Pleurodeles waltl]|uniref:Uncharacterized protein n=1 Tax=Pleurodeles waltl TaxID=8319 RepID=A0AAV7UHF1_PLEWA|nr:hypothetical protein NDU88_004180 [Pleurodeles waltl]